MSPDLATLPRPDCANAIPARLPGFEVEHAVERMLGRPELWWQALALFVEHFADWEKRWDNALSPDEERRCIHALRSAAANVGAHHLSCVAGALETLLARQAAGDPIAPPPFLRDHLRSSFRELWQTACLAHFGPAHQFRAQPS